MDETIVLGHEAKIKINDTAFAVRRGRVRLVADRHETGDTESAEFKRHKGGRKVMEVDLEFYEDNSVQYHAGVLTIQEGDSINLKVFTKGLDFDPYECPTFGVFEFEMGLDVDNPNNGRLVGASDGPYFKPDET